MATIIEQQVVLDEALVPSTQRLRIGISNFRLPSDIQSKESTLEVVYDVLRRCPFFKAFLVTADHIINLETFRDMLHICPRIPGQSFDELPLEEEILEFLRFLKHSAQIRTLTDVNINKLFQPWRSFGAVINKCLTGKSSGFDSFRSQPQDNTKKDRIQRTPSKAKKNKLEDHHRPVRPSLNKKKSVVDTKIISSITNSKSNVNFDLKCAMCNGCLFSDNHDSCVLANTKAYKEYYACTTGKAVPKPKASAKRKRSGSDTSITPPIAITTLTTTGAVTPRLTAAAKGKQLAKAKSLSDPSELARTEAQQLKIEEIAKTDEQDDAERGGDDDEETESDEESNGDETREEESFDPIPRTPKDSEDDGNSKEDQGLRISEEEWLTEEEEADEHYRDQESSSVSSQFVTSMLNPTSDVVFRFDERLKSLEASFSEYRQTNPFAEAISNILGNKSIQCSDEQRILYKALMEAYESDKIILDTCGERVILKRRRDDDDDQ
nr:hypothetical protein [Tanacetum cinerariifolium]